VIEYLRCDLTMHKLDCDNRKSYCWWAWLDASYATINGKIFSLFIPLILN